MPPPHGRRSGGYMLSSTARMRPSTAQLVAVRAAQSHQQQFSMRAAHLRPACVLPASQGARCEPAGHSAQPQWTRRQLQGALAAALLLGPQRAAAAAEVGSRRQEMQQIEQAYNSYAGV